MKINNKCESYNKNQQYLKIFNWKSTNLQGWEFAHSFIAHLLIAQIAQIKWVTVSDSLRSLRKNERLWANCSGCSCQKSDREQIAQVAHDKRVTVSDLLRLLMINMWMSDSLKTFWLKSYLEYVFCTLKKEPFAHSLFLMSHVSGLLRSLTKKERCEWIAQVAHQKWANEYRSFFWANHSFAHFFCKKQAIHSKNRWVNSQPCKFENIPIKINNICQSCYKKIYRIWSCCYFCLKIEYDMFSTFYFLLWNNMQSCAFEETVFLYAN